MIADLVVRDARPADRDAVRALTHQAYAVYSALMTASAWAALAGALDSALASDAPAHRIVADHQGRIVGSVMLFPAASAAYGDQANAARFPELRLLAIAPGMQGQGIGERLVRECIRRAKDDGAAELGLHTSSSMATASRMYARLGFVRAPATDFQPEGAELVQGFRLVL